MLNSWSRNGEVNKLKRSNSSVIGDHNDCKWKKNKNRKSEKWSRKETMLWKTEHSLDTDKSLLNLPGVENRKQIHLIYGKYGKYPSSWWWRKKDACCVWLSTTRNMTLLLIQWWHFSHCDKVGWFRWGESSIAQDSVTAFCLSAELCIITEHNYSVWQWWRELSQDKSKRQRVCTFV